MRLMVMEYLELLEVSASLAALSRRFGGKIWRETMRAGKVEESEETRNSEI
jgi:hypothetical protein